MKRWLDDLLKGESDPRKIGALIESEFMRSFKYSLGVPDLKRSAPVEDFIFNQKEGHCERYASALALLLRMKDIPSRVVIGYHVPPPNQFADFYSVQAKDAHAWVEAYIQSEEKWVIFDGTPTGGDSARDKNTGFAYTVKDWLEYVWYSKIVEFSPDDQQGLFEGVKGTLKSLLSLIKQKSGWATTLILIILIALVCYKVRDLFLSISIFRKRAVKDQVEIAASFYRELLVDLAKINIYRPASLTPYEFLEDLKKKNIGVINEIQLITDCFCIVKYAGETLPLEQIESAEKALKAVRVFCSEKSSKF